jgi:glutamine---fructose-6-phosphate transaminase (isomerizing)
MGSFTAPTGPVLLDDGAPPPMPDAVGAVLGDPEPADRLAARWADSARLFVAARGLLYAAALEAALKIKETTGILAEGISAADLRHGPIGVAGGDVPVLALDGGGAGREDVRAVAGLARERGAPVAVCGDAQDAELPLPQGVPEALAVFPATVRAQQLAAAMAATRGIDPDSPAGLTKVTPTE